jgi:hypothetical protein
MWWNGRAKNRDENALALLQTCRQTHSEAYEIPWSHNTFRFPDLSYVYDGFLRFSNIDIGVITSLEVICRTFQPTFQVYQALYPSAYTSGYLYFAYFHGLRRVHIISQITAFDYDMLNLSKPEAAIQESMREAEGKDKERIEGLNPDIMVTVECVVAPEAPDGCWQWGLPAQKEYLRTPALVSDNECSSCSCVGAAIGERLRDMCGPNLPALGGHEVRLGECQLA